MPVTVMRQVLTHAEFTKWLAYFKYKQPDVTEIQLAVLSTIVASAAGNKDVKVKDFLISNKSGEPPKPISSNEIKSIFGAMAVKKE